MRHHAPGFTVRLTWKVLVGILVGCLVTLLLLPALLRAKGV